MNNLKSSSNIISIEDIKKRYKIGNDTAYALVKERSFPAFKVGRRWNIIESDLEKWERERSKERIA
ncbi:MAG: helix-turn-helix domain-containing protein [Eubacteriaceae bacterium]|nr:helix-turn-helix domain-containing protein [Eubacteriaceae bacterium]